MKLKNGSLAKKIAIALSAIMIAGAIVIIFQMYFSYIEVKEIADQCYDKGGFPIIEKSGLTIDYFHCEME